MEQTPIPLNPNINKVGEPEVYSFLEKPKTYISGKDGVSIPKSTPALGKIVPALKPNVIKAQFPRFKDLSVKDLRYLGTEQGLKNAHITCLLKDSRGLIWIGTRQGVIFYDGIIN